MISQGWTAVEQTGNMLAEELFWHQLSENPTYSIYNEMKERKASKFQI